MDKKILAVMVTLVVVALLVVAFVMVAAGGFTRGGSFTPLFEKMQNTGGQTYKQYLSFPSDWKVNKKITVTDTIADMSYYKQTVGTTSVYITELWFVYYGEKWNNPTLGSHFFVPDTSTHEWLEVYHGMFSISVSSATNLSAKYHIGGDITLQTTLALNGNQMLAFDVWAVASTL